MGGVTIIRADGGDPDQPKDGELIADRRLYINAANTRLVEDGDPSAAFLLAGEGGRIAKGDVQRLGLELVDGRVVQAPLEKSEQVEAILDVREKESQPDTMLVPVENEQTAPSAPGGDQQPGADSSAAAT
jgi:hypothetical protein